VSTTVATNELWGAAKIAEVMGLSRSTVWRYVRWGRLPAPAEVIGSEWTMVWRADEFLAWMEDQGLEAPR